MLKQLKYKRMMFYFMEKKKKIDLELEKMDFTKVALLSKKNTSLIIKKRKHIKSLSNLLNLLTFLVLAMLFVDSYKYSEYVLLIIGLLSITTISYVNLSKIKTKIFIKKLLFPKQRLNENKGKTKLRIYYNKFLDRAEIISSILISIWAFIAIVWSAVTIIVHIN